MSSRLHRLVPYAVWGLVLLGAFGMIEPFIRQILYPVPPYRVPSPPPPPLVEVTLSLPEGGRAVAWVSGSARGGEAPVVLFFHGNGENLETMRLAGTFDAFDRLGVTLLAVDYPGYGLSPGTPSEASLAASSDAALAWAEAQHPGRPVIAAGWSLGAAVAISLAARAEGRLAGLAALSAWTRLHDVARLHFPLPLLHLALSDSYDSLAAAPAVRLPTLVIHGEVDDIIPAQQGQVISEALAGPVRWVSVPGAGHNDLLGRRQVWQELAAFLSRWRSPSEPAGD